MPTLETIRSIIVRSRTEGVDKATADLRKLSEAQDGVAVASDKTSKATISAEAALRKQERTLDTGYRSAEQFRKTVMDLDRAHAQGLITSSRHGELMQLAAERATRGAQATGIYSAAQNAAAGTAANFAGRLGPVGSVLTSIGPAGLAAGAAIGVLGYGMYEASQHAHAFAADMVRVRDTAETVGLTALQFQALADEGSKFALSEEKVGQVLQRVTAQMEEFRRGQGELFDLTRRIDPALAAEMATARNTAEAIDYLAKVYAKAGEARGKLDRLIAGKGGGSAGLLFQEVGGQGGMGPVTGNFGKSGDAITDDMIRRVALLKTEIDDMSGDARRNIAAIFSLPVLQAEHQFTETFRDLSRSAREFTTSESFDRFGMTMLKIITAGPAAIMRGLGVSGSGSGGVSFADRYAPADGSLKPWTGADRAAYDKARERTALERTINLEQSRLGVLASAATAVDRLDQSERRLKLALMDNVITQEQYNRALTVDRADAANQTIGLRISLLGDNARAADVAAKAENDIAKAQALGAKLTAVEIEQIKERNRLQFEYSTFDSQLAFERDQLGRGTIDAAVAARLRAAGKPIDLDSVNAMHTKFNEQLRPVAAGRDQRREGTEDEFMPDPAADTLGSPDDRRDGIRRGHWRLAS